MTLTELEGLLNAQTTAQGLPLSSTVSPEVGALVSPLQLTRLLVRTPVVTRPVEGELSLTGQADVFGGTAAVTMRGVGEDAPVLTLRLELPPHWGFEDGFAGLPPSYKPDPAYPSVTSAQHSLLYDLVLAGARIDVTPATSTAASVVAFTATTGLPGMYERLRQRMGLDAELPVTGALLPRRDGPAEVDLAVGTPVALSVGGFGVDATSLRVWTRKATSTLPALTQLLAQGTVHFGTTDPVPVQVTAEYEGDEDYFAFTATVPAPGLTISRGVHALAELAGGSAQDFMLPPGLDLLDSFALDEIDVQLDAEAAWVRHLAVRVSSPRVWTIVQGLAVSGIAVRWKVDSPFDADRVVNVGLTGVLELGSTQPVRFDVSAAGWSQWTVEGRLRKDTPIDLAALVKTALDLSADLPSIDVDTLSVEASTSGDFRLDGGLSTDWAIDIGHKQFMLQRVTCTLQKTGTHTQALLYARADVAGTLLYVQATVTSATGTGTGILFEGGTLPTGDPISLTGVVSWALDLFGASLPSSVPDVTLSNLELRFNTATKEFHFEGETDVPIEVPFLAGNDNRIHAAANLTTTTDAATGQSTLTGWMEGDLLIGGSVFRLRYAMGLETHLFQASWELQAGAEPLGINTLLERIGAPSIDVPKGVDLNLKRVYFEYTAESGAMTLVADSATYGEAFLTASRPIDPETGELGSEWAFVFGVEYDARTLSQVPVLGSAMGAADIFTFEELGIVIASAAVQKYTLPALPPMQTVGGSNGTGSTATTSTSTTSTGTTSTATTSTGSTASTGTTSSTGTSSTGTTSTSTTTTGRKPVAAGTTVDLVEGISFLGIIDFEQSRSGGTVDVLKSVLPASKLTITAEYDVGATEFTLAGVLQGAVVIPTGGSSDLTIANARVEMAFPNPIEFRVSGTLDFTLDHQPISVKPALLLTETEAEFTTDLQFGDGGWKSPMGIEGLTLDEVGFEMGVNFVPPGLNIGLQGASHIGVESPKADRFAFVLEMVEELPDPLLLSFQLAEISVDEAMRVFVPGVDASGLPQFIRDIRFTDVAFYWADSVVPLPDGTVAKPGTRFRGNVQAFNAAAHGEISIDTTGISGEIMLSPIHLGSVISVTGAGTGVYLYERDGQIVVPQVQPDPDAPPATRVAIVEPGGAVAQFRTQQSPWLYASIDVVLFDAASAAVEAIVGAEGVHFKLVMAISDAVSAELDCNASKSSFKAHAQFGLHLKAELGPVVIAGVDFGSIDLDSGFDLEMTLEISADEFLLQLGGDFEFEGARLTFPTLKLNFAPASLTELPGRLIGHLQDNVETVFADLFDEAGKLLEEGARAVAEAAEAAAAEVAEIGTAAVQEAEQIVGDAEEAVTHAAEAAAKEAEKIEQEAAQITADAAKEVEEIGRAAAQEVERIGGEIASVAESAAREVEAIGREIADEAKQVEQAVSKLASDAAAEAANIAHAAEEEVQKLVADAQKVANDVISAARNVVSELTKQADALWNEAKKLADEIAEEARKAEKALENAGKKAWHKIKSY